MRLSASVLFLLVACGGGETPTTTAPTATPVPEEKPSDGGEHPKLTAELDAFHEVLAPRWHGEPGPQRTKDTCAAIGEFKARGAAVKAASAPAGADAAAWGEAGTKLETTVIALEAECTAGAADQAKFDAAFSAVHDAFHHAMELAGGGHGEHGQGHGQGEHGQGHGQGEHGQGDSKK